MVHSDQTKIFELLLLEQIRRYPGFNHWPFPSPRAGLVKKLTDFFLSITQSLLFVYQRFILKNLYCAIMFGFHRPRSEILRIMKFFLSCLSVQLACQCCRTISSGLVYTWLCSVVYSSSAGLEGFVVLTSIAILDFTGYRVKY